MSILEIVLYIIIGSCVVFYISKNIYTMVDRKKHPQKYKNKNDKEREKLDE